jgi:tRNA A58 N-methylase Trm61
MRRVPYVPTPNPVVKKMLELAQVGAGETVYDLGAGDGRVLIHAVREYEATGVGIENNRARVVRAERNLRLCGVEDKAKIVRQDFFRTDLSNADVVTLYLLPDTNRALLPKLLTELKPGARIVTHDFPLPMIKPVIKERLNHNGESHYIFLYHPFKQIFTGVHHTRVPLCAGSGY